MVAPPELLQSWWTPSRLLVIKIFLTSSHSMSEPGQEEQKPSFCFASIVNLFSSDNFFSYFVLAFLNMRWPNMNWCQKCQLRSFFCLSLILYLPLSAVHLPPRIVWDPVCSLDSGLAPVAAVIQQCEIRTTTLGSNLNHPSTGLTQCGFCHLKTFKVILNHLSKNNCFKTCNCVNCDSEKPTLSIVSKTQV